MRLVMGVLKTIDRISEWSGRISIWLIVPLTGLVVYEVISRRILDSPHIWATEVITFIYAPYFMLVAAYTLKHKAHVGVDILSSRFHPRTRGCVQILSYLIFFFPFCLVLLDQGLLFAKTSWAQGETSGSAALPVVPWVKTVIPLTFLFLLIQGLGELIRGIVLFLRGREI